MDNIDSIVSSSCPWDVRSKVTHRRKERGRKKEGNNPTVMSSHNTFVLMLPPSHRETVCHPIFQFSSLESSRCLDSSSSHVFLSLLYLSCVMMWRLRLNLSLSRHSSRHENTWERKKRKRESRRTLQLHMIIISLKSQVREINAVNNKLVCPWSTSHTRCAHHEPVTVVLSYQSESLLFCRERLPTKKTNTLIVLTVFVFLCLLISWQPSLPYPLHTSKW